MLAGHQRAPPADLPTTTQSDISYRSFFILRLSACPVFFAGTERKLRLSNIEVVSITKKNCESALYRICHTYNIQRYRLYKQVDVFKDYFGELEEESIRDNFVIIYELLDETMDFGYPQTMESKILREYITQVRVRDSALPPSQRADSMLACRC